MDWIFKSLCKKNSETDWWIFVERYISEFFSFSTGSLSAIHQVVPCDSSYVCMQRDCQMGRYNMRQFSQICIQLINVAIRILLLPTAVRKFLIDYRLMYGKFSKATQLAKTCTNIYHNIDTTITKIYI